MQNLYPLFERNRILKKELLWSLRDYSFAHVQLEYQEYGQGLLLGWEVRLEGNTLIIGPGILKYNQFICILTEDIRILCRPEDQFQYVRLRIDIDKTSPDYIAYRIEPVLTMDGIKKENEYELCRFHLRAGAQLRDRYKDFRDMGTEYDTINLIYGDWGGLGGNSIAPAVTRYFAEIILGEENCRPEDSAFAYMCLSHAGSVPLKALLSYTKKRGGNPEKEQTGLSDIYECLCGVCDHIRSGERMGKGGKKERRQIFVD